MQNFLFKTLRMSKCKERESQKILKGSFFFMLVCTRLVGVGNNQLWVNLEQMRQAVVVKSAASLEKAPVLKHGKGEEKGEERKT